MENASQALIIGGTILIAMIVLSLGVYLALNANKVGESYNQNLETVELTKFNSRFVAFEEREDITAQEIVTLYKFVEESESDVTFLPQITNHIDFIKTNSTNASGEPIYFKCTGENCIQYTNGKVSSITFTK